MKKYYAITAPEYLERTTLICPRCGGIGYIETAVHLISVDEVYQQTQPIVCPYCSDDDRHPLKIGDRIVDGGTREGFFDRLIEDLKWKKKK
jgi:hypothetical protein